MRKPWIVFGALAFAAAGQGAAADDCSVSSSVTTGPGGTVVSGSPGETYTIYDAEGRRVGVVAVDRDCAAGASGSTSASGGTSSTVRSGDGSTSVTTGSGAGSSSTTQGGMSSSVTVGPGGVSGRTTTK